MIFQREIAEKAREWGVPATTVDKDYVLGHFLHCFFNFEENRSFFVFKGGTCLRKCYFPNYRFSEDLDFTLIDKTFVVNETFIQNIIQDCANRTGIRFNLVRFEKKQFQNKDKGYRYVIGFWGANHNQNRPPAPTTRWTTNIELDISFDEEILYPINYLKLEHPYSDANLGTIEKIPAYALEEILTEKVRAFYQRSYKAPRDFYDVWYLLQNNTFNNWDQISNILKEKCKLKNVVVNPELFLQDDIKKTVSISWQQSIAHHLSPSQLPAFEEVWNFLKEHLFTIYLKL